MKKGKALLLVSLLIPFSLCACNSQNQEDNKSNEDNDTQQNNDASNQPDSPLSDTVLHTTGDLKIIKNDQRVNELAVGGFNFKFLGAKNEDNNLTFYNMPVYQYPTMPSATDGYQTFSVNFVGDGGGETKNVFLSSFSINHVGGYDVSNAVRVAFLDEEHHVKYILSKNPNGETIATKGSLDLNANDRPDTDYWDNKDIDGNLVEYTTGADTLISNPYSDILVSGDNYDSAKALTTTENSKMLTMVIWIDFWACQSITEPYFSSFISQDFRIEMTFVC